MIVTGKSRRKVHQSGPPLLFLNFRQARFPIRLSHGQSSTVKNSSFSMATQNALEGKIIEIKEKSRITQDKQEIVLDSTNQLRYSIQKGVNITATSCQSTNQAPVMPQPPQCRSRPPATARPIFPKSCDGGNIAGRH